MKNWRSILVSPQSTLEESIAILERGAKRIVMVVDSDGRLLGTLTDGDLRRALLRHLPMNVPVCEVMCSTPHVAKIDWSRERVLSVMESTKLLQIPIVDGDHRVVGLETVHELLDSRLLDNPVFLMAGGFGRRLHPLTNNCPKPLLKIGSKPILELIIDSFISAGFHRFFISTHYLPDMIREHFEDGSRWGVNIQYIHEDHPLGTGGALGLLPHEEITLPLLMMNGDLLTRVDYRGLLEFHRQHENYATVCVREYESQIPYGVIQCDGHRITSIVEKPIQRFFINAAIYLLSPDFVKSVKRGTKIDMPTLLERRIAEGKDVTMFPIHEYWLDIGRIEDFQRAQIEMSTS